MDEDRTESQRHGNQQPISCRTAVCKPEHGSDGWNPDIHLPPETHTHTPCSTCTTNAAVCEAQRQEVSQLYASSKAAGSEQVKRNESKFRIRSEEKIISSLQLLNINSTNRNVLTHKLKNFKQEEAQIYSDSLLVSVSQFVLSCGFSSLRRSDPSESVITSLCNCTEMKETKCVFRFRNRCFWKTHSVFTESFQM